VKGTTIRVLHCDRSRLYADVFDDALRRRDHEVAWIAHPDELATSAALDAFDVCLTETTFRQLSGLTVVTRLRQQLPEARIVVLTRTGHRAVAEALLDAGASAVVPKTAPMEFAIQAVEGERTGMVAPPPPPLATPREPAPADGEAMFLTPREHEVLAGLANGHRTEHIAKQLGVAHTTARTYIQNILTKLGVHSKVQAVAVAFALDLVGPGDLAPAAAVDTSGALPLRHGA
jgi:two-component system nitrate/nitrite response regulator NarL